MAVISYKCPNCDAPIVFEPGTQQFHCEYCATYFPQSQLESMQPNRAKASVVQQEEASSPQDTAVLYSCPSCGAEVAADATTAATICYYCHNPVIVSGRLSGELLPSKVIPFAIQKEQAVQMLLDWVGKKKFVPRGFFSKQQIEEITGVYFPYWIVNGTVQSRMDARATRERRWRQGETEFTETSVYRVIREGEVVFREITKSALRKANRNLVESVQPYDSEGFTDFSMGLLSGFQAEKRDMESDDLSEEVAREIGNCANALLRRSITGYSSVLGDAELEDAQTNWEYALLPVWVLTYKQKNELFYFALNGQTGKIRGRLPVDMRRLMMLFVAIFIPLFFIISWGALGA